MDILVLDTVHGGKDIGAALAGAGNSVDMVDVYHGTTPDAAEQAKQKAYDLIVAPVHLDPSHPLLRKGRVPVISHHEAVRQLLGADLPRPMIEITGARGKTTTAHALAHLLTGKGVLHTSTGTISYPLKEVLWKKSITPASVLPAARYAARMNGWLIAEESLGVTGAGDLAIITSSEDYTFASGRKCAVKEKVVSARHAKRLLVAPGIRTDHEHAVGVDEIARVDGIRCTFELEGIQFSVTNPLFLLPPYRAAMMLAGAAAMLLHVDPTPLNHFTALAGRMSLHHEGDLILIDNANSGTNVATTMCAARYARHVSRINDLTLVIGQMEGDGAVCEGFPPDLIAYTIGKVHPVHVVWVGEFPQEGTPLHQDLKGVVDAVCPTLEEAREKALAIAKTGSIVLAVKTWR
jgi:UDP-N-acetylmuramyl pentapeptide synthase